MKAELDETLRQTYENSLQVFDGGLNSLHVNADVLQNMRGAAAPRGLSWGSRVGRTVLVTREWSDRTRPRGKAPLQPDVCLWLRYARQIL